MTNAIKRQIGGWTRLWMFAIVAGGVGVGCTPSQNAEPEDYWVVVETRPQEETYTFEHRATWDGVRLRKRYECKCIAAAGCRLDVGVRIVPFSSYMASLWASKPTWWDPDPKASVRRYLVLDYFVGANSLIVTEHSWLRTNEVQETLVFSVTKATTSPW